VFLINRGELINRADPYYYKLEFVEIINVIKKNSYTSLKKMGVTIKKGIFDISPDLYKNSGVPFLRVADLKNGTINFSSTVFIDEQTHSNEIKTEYLPEDLVFSKVGTIGEVSILPNDYDKYNISQNVVGLKLNEEIKKQIYPRFLQIFLSSTYGKRQIIRNSMAGVQPKITLDALRNVLVPVLNLEKQEKVILSIENAENKKKQKEAEAAALLASIDGYLLQELGITLPPPSEKKTYFLTRSSQLSGGRFDPNCYQPIFSQTIEKIKSGFFNTYHLRELTTFSTESWNGKDFFMEEFPYIEISEIDITFGEIRNTNYIPINEAPSRAKMIVRNDDLIVSTTRPSRGAIAYINQSENELRIASTGFAVLRKSKMQINKYFLLFILKHKMILMQMEQRSSGGNYPAITLGELGNILIPLPPPEKQTEIANHISALRTQAKQLQQQAAAELAHAKQHVEHLILGE
jgi:restriction endonuclease S subunit